LVFGTVVVDTDQQGLPTRHGDAVRLESARIILEDRKDRCKRRGGGWQRWERNVG
jgi:hypothetical protein